MKNFSSYEISSARRILLADILIKNGYDLIPEGSENFRVSGYQGLIVKHHYWYRHSTNEFGNAIDFFMKIEKMSFSDSISKLMNNKIEPNKPLWFFEKETTKARNYLIKNRNMDPDITDQLINLKKIKQDKSNCICFIEYENIDQPLYIFRRSMGDDNQFKGEVRHSEKKYSFQISINEQGKLDLSNYENNIDKLYIVEGAIDACAMATLLKIKKTIGNGKKIKIITTAGHPHKSIKKRISKANPKEIIIATDMDPQGRNFAKIIQHWIDTENYSVPTYDAKDPAELLVKLK